MSSAGKEINYHAPPSAWTELPGGATVMGIYDGAGQLISVLFTKAAGEPLQFTADEWEGFLEAIHNHALDPPQPPTSGTPLADEPRA
jgi:hypothetical protein